MTEYREGKISDWCDTFASATARAAEEAEGLALEIEALQDDWFDRRPLSRSLAL